MELEEAIEHLKKLKKGIEVLNRFASKEDEDLIDIEAIDIVLKELDKEEIICAMAEDMTTIMRDGCSPRKDVKYEYIINGYKKFRNGV